MGDKLFYKFEKDEEEVKILCEANRKKKEGTQYSLVVIMNQLYYSFIYSILEII